MSCFKCGKHRPRSLLKSRRILGRNEMVCEPTCKTVDDIINGSAPKEPEQA